MTKLRVNHDPSLNVFLGMKIQVQVRVHGLGSGFRVQGSGFRLEMQVTGIPSPQRRRTAAQPSLHWKGLSFITRQS